MLRILIVAALALAIPAMAAQHKEPASQHGGQSNKTNFSVVMTQAETANQNAERSSNQSLRWYKFVAWPEGITVWAILFTLAAIIWQALETRKAAESTRASAEAALKSVKLQEAQLQQWVEVREWKVKETIDPDRITITCYVVNPTSMPITILSIKSDGAFAMPPYAQGTRLAVSPRGRCLFMLPRMRLSMAEFDAFNRDALVFAISLTVAFEDALGKGNTQKLSFQCACGRRRDCEVEPLLLWSTHPAESQKAESQEDGQNSN